jgi:probable F420-dependent oxidoreductase
MLWDGMETARGDPVKINITLPFDHIEDPKEFNTHEAVVEIATRLDQMRFNAGLVTDHPVPTGRWLDAGGHHAQDPFVLLALIAGVTRRLRLQTGILVLPYRNPFITARSVATLDVFSGGRVTLSVGAGYLKGEYKALGVDFDRRNELMDEYIAALKAAWTNDEFTFQGSGYEALGNRILPRPVQTPHPPLLIGGNSRRAIRRAVEMADGWNPYFTFGAVAQTSRTAEIANDDDLTGALAYLREHCEKVGREIPPQIVLGGLNRPGERMEYAQMVDRIGRLREMGVDVAAVSAEGRTRAEWLDSAARLDSEVLAKV